MNLIKSVNFKEVLLFLLLLLRRIAVYRRKRTISEIKQLFVISHFRVTGRYI